MKPPPLQRGGTLNLIGMAVVLAAGEWLHAILRGVLHIIGPTILTTALGVSLYRNHSLTHSTGRLSGITGDSGGCGPPSPCTLGTMRPLLLLPVLLLACARPASPLTVQDAVTTLALQDVTCNDTMTRCRGVTTLTPGVVAGKLGGEPERVSGGFRWGLERVRVEMVETIDAQSIVLLTQP